MENNQAIIPVALQFGIEMPAGDGLAGRQVIIEKVNELILTDFEKLVNILYRIDVSEKKINLLLQQFPQQDAAAIITDLMIDREKEKIKSRKEFSSGDKDFTEEEKW